MSTAGQLIVGGHVMDIVSVRLVQACLQIAAVDKSASAYQLRDGDQYTVIGEDGSGIGQGDLAIGNLRKGAKDSLSITVNLRIDNINTGSRTVNDTEI